MPIIFEFERCQKKGQDFIHFHYVVCSALWAILGSTRNLRSAWGTWASVSRWTSKTNEIKSEPGKVTQWLSTVALSQGTWVLLSALTRFLTPSTALVLRNLTPSSHLPRQQACMKCTDMYASKIPIHIKYFFLYLKSKYQKPKTKNKAIIPIN